LQATTFAIPKANVSGTGYYTAYFPSTVAITPGTIVRVTISNTAADSSSNCFRGGNEYTIHNDANSLALMPFEGTLGKSTYNGSTWTDTATTFYPFTLLLDTDAEFAAGGGAGLSRAFTGF
jgi:hypothetical protein